MEVLLTPRLCTRATTDRPRIPVFTDPTAPDPRRTVAVEPQHQRILSAMAPPATVAVRPLAVIRVVQAVPLVHVPGFHLQAL